MPIVSAIRASLRLSRTCLALFASCSLHVASLISWNLHFTLSSRSRATRVEATRSSWRRLAPSTPVPTSFAPSTRLALSSPRPPCLLKVCWIQRRKRRPLHHRKPPKLPWLLEKRMVFIRDLRALLVDSKKFQKFEKHITNSRFICTAFCYKI